MKVVQLEKYMSVTISTNSNCVVDIRLRINSATVKMSRLSKIWDTRSIIFRIIGRHLNFLVVSVMWYG